ncbi:hypothetical protein MED121_19424 [Marinomonas sp. MED121]|uniref:carbohydrate kinase n=1 Tax=Marinomonas sp. MED121 TaxID=314277 RepID=UPI0000690EE4|nr:carbohydrate kinase [Marinomonas sp. MED121]EAQ64280.1 hypothetical protein MED121_19424 [Marinomonas sp. MED121]
MSEQETRVLTAVKKSPLATQQELANQLGMSRESVAGHIMRLTNKGFILGKGYIVPEDNNIVVIGGCNLDICGRAISALRLEDSNLGQISQSPGGVGRNIAENLSRLGQDVSLISAIGQDKSGDWLLEQCRSSGINMDAVIRHPDFGTSTYLALNDPHGQLVAAVSDMAIINTLDGTQLSHKKSLLLSAQTLLIEANLSEACIEWLAQLNCQGSLYADAVSVQKSVRLKPILHRLTGLKVNRDEAKALTGLADASDKELIQALLKAGVKNVLLSLGNEGVIFANHKEQASHGIFTIDAVSDTGAGDALFAGFIHAQLNTWPIAQSLEFASACSAMTLESDSANTPNISPKNIEKWIANK